LVSFRCSLCGKVVNAPDGTTAGYGKCPHCGAMVDLAKAERVGLQPGDIVGGCRVEALTGRGGMAAVYRATQLSLDRPVALKVLAHHLARRGSFVERFDREATALAQLSHANIVNILDKGAEGGVYFFVMEFVEGESLRARLRARGKLPLAEAVALFDQVAAGLEYAHSHDVLHRDIKPENILITPGGEAKLADFGIARIAGDDTAAQHRLTAAQTRMGTAHYMAPEQMRDAATVDHRADIYALGVTLYEMLTGELPIGQFKRASGLVAGVPTAVDRVISTALAAVPEERFQSVAEFGAALRAAARGGPVGRVRERAAAPAKRFWGPGAIAAAALLLVGGIALGVIALGPSRRQPQPVAKALPPKPDEAQQREDKANELLALASRRAALGKLTEAKALLAELEADYTSTKFFAENKADITELRKQVAAMLEPKAAPEPREPPKPEPEPEPKAKAEPEPPPKEKVEPKETPPPKTEPEPPPKQGPPPEPKHWVLFDGTSLDGWRVVEPVPGGRRGEGVHLANGQAVIDGGKRVAGMAWSRDVPHEGYELALEAMRTDGHSGFAYVVFPVGDAACSLVVGGLVGSGLDAVDGLTLTRNETRRDLSLESDRWYKVSVRVTPTRIEARVDQAPLVEFPIAGHQFTVPQWCDGFKPLGILTWRNSLAVRSVRLRRLTFAPAKVVKADPTKAEELLAAMRPLWAKRSYDAALDAVRTSLAEAKDDATQAAGRTILRAAEVLPRFWKIVAAGADAMKGKTFTSKGITGRILGVKGDSLALAFGPGETSRKLTTLEGAELLGLARAGADPDSADDHLALALFAAFDEGQDLPFAHKELAAAAAAGADTAELASLIALSGMPAFRKAMAVARQRAEAGDFAATRKILAEAQRLKPNSAEAAPLVESTLQALLGRAVAACKAADFPRATDLMGLAEALDPKHPDVVKLGLWLKTHGRPVIVETFDTVRLDRWDIESGVWRVLNARLTCKVLFQDAARIFLRGPKAGYRDFLFTFDVGNSSDGRSFRFGTLFREQRRREEGGGQFLYCLLSGTHYLLCAGGATGYVRTPVGVVDGVKFRYTRQDPVYLGGQRFPVDVGKLYHMAVRCMGNAFECYVNDQLVVEGVAGAADSGRIGFLVQGGECVFDNVKLYTPAPLPALVLLGGEIVVEEPEDPQERREP